MVSSSFAGIPPLHISPSTSIQSIIRNPNPCYWARRNLNSYPPFSTTTTRRNNDGSGAVCRAKANSSASLDSLLSSTIDFDLYDLLGVASDSDQLRIKTAYRSLQKRCHPDIAGPVGHDMAIILNEAYALLSDPTSRSAYDKEHAKTIQIQGYNGKPLYSAWFGPESENRAVFVDEVKCVGCLKCALFASSTFAIESTYGRARVVAQWADTEPTIQEAIDSCPVNCISMVERSDLPALEFLMSKQPRGNVRIGVGNTVGPRASDVFNEVKLLQKRFEETKKKETSQHSQGSDLQRERRISAVKAIRSISNWLYQQQPTPDTRSHFQHLTHFRVKSPTDPTIDKLKAVAAKRRQAMAQGGAPRLISHSSSVHSHDEYWVPSSHVLPPATHNSSLNTTVSPAKADPPNKKNNKSKAKYEHETYYDLSERPMVWWGAPLGSSLVGAMLAWMQGGSQSQVAGLEEHVGGILALEIVNSFWLQIVLAGASWYVVGTAVALAVDAIVSRGRR